MEIEFVSGMAVIAPDPAQSRRLYVDTLGLPLTSEGGDYFHSEHIPGAKHFGVWPLSQAAQACFGSEQWPAHLAVPQVSIEFDVAGTARVQDAADELSAAGLRAAAPGAPGAVGADRRAAAVARGGDRGDLVHTLDARVARRRRRSDGVSRGPCPRRRSMKRDPAGASSGTR